MIETTRRARPQQTERCPICKQAIDGDKASLVRHVADKHAKPENQRGEIIWTKPPHEAVFMGKHYKAKQN